MEYVRRQRWAKYGSSKCKEYLRNDFSYECAYCKLQEYEAGLIGADYFEIDHFKPQSLSLSDIHEYHNLYYACKKCNSEKSDTYDDQLLDPCVDDIFGGDTPAIVGGTEESKYKYIATNDKGVFYINTFKLNSRSRINIRKRRIKHQNDIRIIDALINEVVSKIKNNEGLQDMEELVEKLDELRIARQKETDKYPKGDLFEKVEEYLNDHGIENSIIFDEHNMDIQVKINNNTYCCEVLFDDSSDYRAEYRKKLNMEKVRVWFEAQKSDFGVLYYYPKLNRMYFYPISDELTLEDVLLTKQVKQIKINDENLVG